MAKHSIVVNQSALGLGGQQIGVDDRHIWIPRFLQTYSSSIGLTGKNFRSIWKLDSESKKRRLIFIGMFYALLVGMSNFWA
jgi:hypothetical protein